MHIMWSCLKLELEPFHFIFQGSPEQTVPHSNSDMVVYNVHGQPPQFPSNHPGIFGYYGNPSYYGQQLGHLQAGQTYS